LGKAEREPRGERRKKAMSRETNEEHNTSIPLPQRAERRKTPKKGKRGVQEQRQARKGKQR